MCRKEPEPLIAIAGIIFGVVMPPCAAMLCCAARRILKHKHFTL